MLVPRDPDAREAPAKLTDFGGASLAGEQALTRTGETLGTLAYMAPEQSEGLQIDESADVYALALVIYEGLTGVNPVRGPTAAATARRIGRPLPPLAARRPDLPRALSDAIDTAVAIEPEDRGTLHELRSALELALVEGTTRRRGLLRRRAERTRPDDGPHESGRMRVRRPYPSSAHRGAPSRGASPGRRCGPARA